ncbi:hypothetical protein PpBr36_07559 [Pyricularia pennisetigena]|uniref:hypothetical protein n=1 Tax=Pyricularia pennisetigena TaxID=1578925 RepID=UPI00114E0F30|nr:hypothetical protein PpBr36_07559 [Pyricularia pennisetigena]TLS25615.1 hypothetical protein PpBr36_07559 [Pyricularia pennisetigena]
MASSPTPTSPFYSWREWEAGACIVERAAAENYSLNGQRQGDVTCREVDMVPGLSTSLQAKNLRTKEVVEDDRCIRLAVASLIGTSTLYAGNLHRQVW